MCGASVIIASAIFAIAYLLIRTAIKSAVEEAIKAEFSKYIEEYKSKLSTKLEVSKSSLVKSQAMFLRQLEALTELNRIYRGLSPTKTHSEMVWHDVCEMIAWSFERHVNDLETFLRSYTAFIPSSVFKTIEAAISTANNGREFTRDPIEPTYDAIISADKFYDTVLDAVTKMQESIDVQITPPVGKP